MSYSWGESFFDLRLSAITPVELNPISIAALFQKFVQLNPADKDVLRIVLDRLNQALRETRLVDKAIDLGIALEAMLLHGSSGAELRYRQAVRGAMFLGGKKVDRIAIYKLLMFAYDLRSTAVHTGSLGGKNDEQVHKTLISAADVCAKIARKLIERGSFPNWEDDFVIIGD